VWPPKRQHRAEGAGEEHRCRDEEREVQAASKCVLGRMDDLGH
jgi:hypothetical protein